MLGGFDMMNQLAAEAAGVAAYLDIRTASSPVWLTDGGVAFISDASGVPNVWISRSAQEPVPLTDFPDRVSTVSASPAADRLIIAIDHGGNERHQLWLLTAGSGEARALTEEPEVIHSFGAFAPGGQRVAFANNARDLRFFDVLTMSIEDGAAIPILTLSRDEQLSPVAFAPDGSGLLIRRDNTNLDADLLLMPLDGNDLVELTPHAGEASVPYAAFDPSGQAVWFISNEGREWLALTRLDIGTGQRDVVVERPWDVEAFAVAEHGDWIAYAVNDDGNSRLTLRSRTSGEERAVSGLPDGVAEGLTWSPDGTRVAFSLSGPRRPGGIWACGLDGIAYQVVGDAFGSVDPATLRAPEVIRYPTFDGRKIPAFWYTPTTSGPWPVVVDVHGGPESQRRTQFAPITQFLLSRGYAVLAPNVRGSTGYGKSYCHLDDVERRMDAVADLAAAADWLSSRDDVRNDRIAVMGQSHGGFMTLAALTTYPDRWAAGVDVVGIADFVTFLERTGPWRRSRRAAEYGDLERDAELLRDISPLHKVDRIRAPLIVVHGRNDPRVPLFEAEQIVAALEARGRPTELLVFDDEGHGLVKRANRIAGYSAIASFLDAHLIE
jgi:dipeptidyl aminopeptidase/acylaminoacyl peptidase